MNPLVKLILEVAMGIAAARDRFNKAIGNGGYRSGRYHGGWSRKSAREGLRGSKLARHAAEGRFGTMRGVRP